MWRVVLAKVATRAEIEASWTLSDLLDAHLVLDHQEDLQEAARKEAEEERGRP